MPHIHPPITRPPLVLGIQFSDMLEATGVYKDGQDKGPRPTTYRPSLDLELGLIRLAEEDLEGVDAGLTPETRGAEVDLDMVNFET